MYQEVDEVYEEDGITFHSFFFYDCTITKCSQENIDTWFISFENDVYILLREDTKDKAPAIISATALGAQLREYGIILDAELISVLHQHDLIRLL